MVRACTVVGMALLAWPLVGCQSETQPQAFASATRRPDSAPMVRPAPIRAKPMEALPTLEHAPGITDCTVERRALKMFWEECGPGFECVVKHDTGRPEVYLKTPAEGPVVLEAHLMTDMDDLNGYWPSHGRHGIQEHYRITQEATGYEMRRRQPWAPAGEGGCQYGQGSATHAVPVEAEAWYINMFWRDRPEQGTRMIVYNPANGRAVVTAAGYETGPGSNTAVAGVSEETHHHLGTTHRDSLVVGFAADQTLPYGPVTCAPGTAPVP